MSQLQIALLIIGAVVIAAVIVYNRVQEARFRKRAERSFGVARADALLEPSGREERSGEERIEPQLPASAEAPEFGGGMRQEPQAPALAPAPADSVPASHLDYVAEIRGSQPLAAQPLKDLLATIGPLAARTRLLGQGADGSWQPLDLSAPVEPTAVRVALQLVDRRGAVTRTELSSLQSAVAVCAAALSASAEIPDPARSVDEAQALDSLCAEADVEVGMNVVAPAGRPFGGTRLRGVLEAAGFRLTPTGAFSYSDPQGHVLYRVENIEQTPFSPENLRQIHTTGITLLLEVPRQRDGVRTFDQMVAAGRQLAVTLGGALVDDNRTPVSEPGLEQIRAQLRAIYATMEARGIPGGSPDALRLFS
jgi:FtsZ-interacting cell division protein ZipA